MGSKVHNTSGIQTHSYTRRQSSIASTITSLVSVTISSTVTLNYRGQDRTNPSIHRKLFFCGFGSTDHLLSDQKFTSDLSQIMRNMLRLADDVMIAQSSMEKWAHIVNLTFVSKTHGHDQIEGSSASNPGEVNFNNEITFSHYVSSTHYSHNSYAFNDINLMCHHRVPV